MRGRFHAGLRREAGGAFCDRNSARLKGGLGVEIPMGRPFHMEETAGEEGALAPHPNDPPDDVAGLGGVWGIWAGKDRGVSPSRA